MVAIAGATLDKEEFLRDYWNGELYIDEDKRAIFPVLGAGSQGVLSGAFSWVTGGTVADNVKKSRDEYPDIPDSRQGEGLKLGGLWVIDSQGILFEHKEKSWGDHAGVEEVKAAVDRIRPSPSADTL
jgi:hypothetical protein